MKFKISKLNILTLPSVSLKRSILKTN